MKTVDLNKAQHFVADNNPYGSVSFQDASKKLWKDKLPFNIFTSEGYITEDAKAFVRENAIQKKGDETWGDAILRYAEWNELGYQCDKAPTKRSDVKFSGSMILNAFVEAQEGGTDYKPSYDNYYGTVSSDEMRYIDEITLDSYK